MKNNIVGCYFILTENCNLRCTYCFEKDARTVSNYMDKETAFKMVDYLFTTAVNSGEDFINITFFGGEPMLCPELMTDILHYAVEKETEYKKEARFSVITNGTVYNDKVESFLEEWVRLKKRIDVQLSIDGTPEIQDINRPCANKCLSSSKLAEECIEKYKDFYRRHKLNPENLHVHACISKASMPKLYEIYCYFTKKLNVKFKFAWVFEDAWDDTDITILDQQMALITPELCKRDKLTLNDFIFKTFDKCSGCSSGRRLCCMDTEGNIYPCHRFFFYDPIKREEVRLGNINDEIPIDEDKRRPFVEMDESTISDKPCQVCIACNWCYGGDLKKLPNEYNIAFMEVLNKYYCQYVEIVERKTTARILDNMAKELTYVKKQLKEMNYLNKRICRLEQIIKENGIEIDDNVD